MPVPAMETSISTAYSSRRFAAVFVVLALLIVVIGVAAYVSLAETLRSREHERLLAVSGLKAEQIEGWIADQLNGAAILSASPFFNETFAQIDTDTDSSHRRRLLARLDAVRAAHRLLSIELFDLNGNKRATSGKARHDSLTDRQPLLRELAVRQAPILLNFHRDPVPGKPLALAIVTTVRDGSVAGSPPRGIVFFNIDPYDRMFPLLKSWPTPSRSAESVLVQTENGEAVIVNELRHSDAVPLSLRFPLHRTELPAVAAALGRSGVFERNDYRGVPVLAATRQVKGTPWSIVSKIDSDEVFEGLRTLALTLSVVVAMAVALAGALLMLAWRQYRLREATAAAEKERNFRVLFDSVTSAIMVRDAIDGTPLQANRTALEYAGCRDIEELRSFTGWLDRPYTFTDALALIHKASAEGPQQFEWQSRDGRGHVVWRDVRLSPVTFDGRACVISVADDITERKRAEANMAEAQRIARLGVYAFDIPADRWTCTEQMDNIFGIGPDYPRTTQSWLALVEPADRDAMAAYLRDEVLGRGQAFDRHYRVVRPSDGAVRWLHGQGRLEHDAEGRPTRLFGVIQDVTERYLVEDQLKLAASVFKHSQQGLVITDEHANIVDVNTAFTNITGYEREDVLGRNPSILKSGLQSAEFYAEMWQALAGKGHWRGEVWNRRKDGRVYAELLTISAVRDERDELRHYVGVITDITAAKEHVERLDKIAHYDALTGIPNRVLLRDRMTQAIAQTQRTRSLMAVCFLDLDGFKPVNDIHGHEAGDHLLVEIAARLRSCLRGGDTVARVGGDEFVLLLLGLEGMEECEVALNRILESVHQPVTVGEHCAFVSASLGVTLYPLDDADADTLLSHADQAMYQAKQAGKNRYRFHTPSYRPPQPASQS